MSMLRPLIIDDNANQSVPSSKTPTTSKKHDDVNKTKTSAAFKKASQSDKKSCTSSSVKSSNNTGSFKRKLLVETNQQSLRMMNLIKSGFRLGASSGGALLPLLLLAIILIHTTSPLLLVRCQDFEDLNKNNNNNNNNNLNLGQQRQPQAQQFAQPQTFQPSRQQQFVASEPVAPQNAAPQQTNGRSSFQRPVLSSRFVPQQQQLSAQASTSSGSSLAAPVAAPPAGQAPTPQQAPSNIEAIMKNALARTAKLEGVESRQDQAAEPVIQSRSGSQFQPAAAAAVSPPVQSQRAVDRQAEPSESTASTQPAGGEQAATTTALANGEPAANHETVYSDQRFANLFARRGAGKKAKFTPTEQVKAKPTLPSFIKSLPDPKQFTSNPLESVQEERRPAPASSNLVSARLQQQQSNQNRVSGQQNNKKNAIGANAALASNTNKPKALKPTAPLGSAQGSRTSGGASNKAGQAAGAAAGAAAAGSKPQSATLNNPFSKAQANSSDPANVIAMARRRLLANNALQQKQQAAAN